MRASTWSTDSTDYLPQKRGGGEAPGPVKNGVNFSSYGKAKNGLSMATESAEGRNTEHAINDPLFEQAHTHTHTYTWTLSRTLQQSVRNNPNKHILKATFPPICLHLTLVPTKSLRPPTEAPPPLSRGVAQQLTCSGGVSAARIRSQQPEGFFCHLNPRLHACVCSQTALTEQKKIIIIKKHGTKEEKHSGTKKQQKKRALMQMLLNNRASIVQTLWPFHKRWALRGNVD